MFNEDERYGSSYPSDNTGNESREASHQSGEYHYSRPEQYNSYGNADYRPSPEPPAMTPRYHYSPPPQESTPPAKRASFGAKSLLALCLVFALLGGAGGGIATYFAMGGDRSEVTSYDDAVTSFLGEEETPSPTSAPTPIAKTPDISNIYSGADIYALGCPQTVGITTSVTTMNIFGQTTTGAVTGSGFIIRENGYILTNHHVIDTAVRGGHEIKVMLHNGEEYTAEVVGYETEYDIAVLKIDAEGLPAATLGDSDLLMVGEPLYVIGNPLGELTYTLTSGLLSALDRDITLQDETTGESKTVNMFQISAAVNSGNSGGPVYSARGEVIGVVTAKYGANGVEGLGFAVPINDAKYIADELITNGYVSGKAFFGISVQTVSAANAEYFQMPQGAYVASVTEGSCADIAGIKIGDVITKLGGQTVTSRSDLTHAKKGYRVGDAAEVEIFRAGETITLTVIFDEEPQSIVEDNIRAQQPETPSENTPSGRQEAPSGTNPFGNFPFFFGGN